MKCAANERPIKRISFSPTESNPMVAADELIDRCRRGDQDAARVLFNGYFDRLLPLAQSRLSRQLSSRYDAEDIVQSVFCSFFCRLKNDWFALHDHDALFRLLV